MSISSSLNADSSRINLEILSDGKVIPDSIAIIAITVEKRLNQASVARIILRDGDPANETFAVSSSDIFVPGVKIVINGGYGTQNSLLFKGEVTAQTIRIKDADESALMIECWNYAVDNRAYDKTPVLTATFGQSILTSNATLTRPEDDFKVQGTVKFQGSALAIPGKYITVQGLGDRFNGDHLMSAVLHQIEEGNWTTEVTIGLAD